MRGLQPWKLSQVFALPPWDHKSHTRGWSTGIILLDHGRACSLKLKHVFIETHGLWQSLEIHDKWSASQNSLGESLAASSWSWQVKWFQVVTWILPGIKVDFGVGQKRVYQFGKAQNNPRSIWSSHSISISKFFQFLLAHPLQRHCIALGGEPVSKFGLHKLLSSWTMVMMMVMATSNSIIHISRPSWKSYVLGSLKTASPLSLIKSKRACAKTSSWPMTLRMRSFFLGKAIFHLWISPLLRSGYLMATKHREHCRKQQHEDLMESIWSPWFTLVAKVHMAIHGAARHRFRSFRHSRLLLMFQMLTLY